VHAVTSLYMRRMFSYLGGCHLLLFVPVTLAAIHPRSDDLPLVEYDFIIVGGTYLFRVLEHTVTPTHSYVQQVVQLAQFWPTG